MWYAGRVLFAITDTRENERGPAQMERVLDVLHQSNPRRHPIRLILASRDGQRGLFADVPETLSPIFLHSLRAAYPSCRIDPVNRLVDGEGDGKVWRTSLLLQPDIFPIRRHPEFTDAAERQFLDPVAIVLASLPIGNGVQARAELEITPCTPAKRRSALRIVQRLQRTFFRQHLTAAHFYALGATHQNRLIRSLVFLCGVLCLRGSVGHDEHDEMKIGHSGEDSIEASKDKLGRHLFSASLNITVAALAANDRVARMKLRELAGAFGVFSSPRLGSFVERRSRNFAWMVSSEEAATLWHIPTCAAQAPGMQRAVYRQMEPPITLPRSSHPNVTILGKVDYAGQRQRFGMLPNDRMRHLYCIGKTGQGKTTLLKQSILSDIRNGSGVAVIDPHGDLVEDILRSIPSQRTNDVILFDVGDRDFPVPFNPLAIAQLEQRSLAADGIVSALKKQFGDSWGPRLEDILTASVLTLLETPGTSFVSLVRLLTDANYRRTVVGNIKDETVRDYWYTEFDRWNERYRTEAIAAVLNKIRAFVRNPVTRHIIGQTKNTFDVRKVMDTGKILLVNLSKGRIGEGESSLLGSFIVSSLQLAAMSRADVPEADRRDFHLYIDEFQNLSTESFGTILSEARKYRLSLTLANQYLGQLEESVRSAVFGNVGSLLCFQIGAEDAEFVSEQLGGYVSEPDLMQLPKYTAYARLLIDGVTQRPFSMQTIPVMRDSRNDRSAVIRRVSRQRFARTKNDAEADVARQQRGG